MPWLPAKLMARSSQSRSNLPSLGSSELQANSPTRTTCKCACAMRERSDSQRDSGHCSGYHAVPSSSGGGACACSRVARNKRPAVSNRKFFKLNLLQNPNAFAPKHNTDQTRKLCGVQFRPRKGFSEYPCNRSSRRSTPWDWQFRSSHSECVDSCLIYAFLQFLLTEVKFNA